MGWERAEVQDSTVSLLPSLATGAAPRAVCFFIEEMVQA